MKNRKKSAVKAKKTLEPRRPALSSMTNNAVALSISAVMLGGTALAQETQDEEEAVLLDTVQIQDRTIDTNPYAEPGAPYKARISGDPRRIKEIADTPATINVLTQTQIEDSGKSDLREVLAAQPGITLGTGEGGNAFGDRYIIRGHEARSDVFVDGLRDPGMTIRESFALEQVEVTKGPSSTFAGRGSTGGAINGITKQASSEYDFVEFQGGLGTDEYYRVQLDANKRITDELAVRANLLYADEEVPSRAPAERLRRGAAISGRYDSTDNKLYMSFDYYFFDGKDDPDLGTQIERLGDPLDVPVYLQKGRDFLESEVHTFTFRGGYDFNENFRVENATRYGFTDNGYVLTGVRGNRTPVDYDFPALRLSTHQGWQEVDYVSNQINVYLDTGLGFTQHSLLLGVEYSEHNVLNGRYQVENRGKTNCIANWRDGAPLRDYFCTHDKNGNMVGGLNSIMDRHITRGDFDSDYSINTTSVYLMDTVDLAYGVFHLSGGACRLFRLRERGHPLPRNNTNQLHLFRPTVERPRRAGVRLQRLGQRLFFLVHVQQYQRRRVGPGRQLRLRRAVRLPAAGPGQQARVHPESGVRIEMGPAGQQIAGDRGRLPGH